MANCRNCGGALSSSARFCPTCGSAVSPEGESPKQTQEQKDAETGKPKTRLVGRIVFPVLLIAGIGIFLWYINPSIHPVIEAQAVVASPEDYDTTFVTMSPVAVRQEGGDIVFSLDELKKHRLVRFEYQGTKTVRPVMAYIAPDGRLVTAISVSEHCGSTEFKIKENQIYCARCPSHWDMMTMEAFACCAKYYPDPIPSRVVGDEVRVGVATLENWAGRL